MAHLIINISACEWSCSSVRSISCRQLRTETSTSAVLRITSYAHSRTPVWAHDFSCLFLCSTCSPVYFLTPPDYWFIISLLAPLTLRPVVIHFHLGIFRKSLTLCRLREIYVTVQQTSSETLYYTQTALNQEAQSKHKPSSVRLNWKKKGMFLHRK